MGKQVWPVSVVDQMLDVVYQRCPTAQIISVEFETGVSDQIRAKIEFAHGESKNVSTIENPAGIEGP